MLLQPFLGALIVLHHWRWAIVPALASVVLVFVVREPLLILARQRFVWRDEHAETASARRYLAIESVLLAAVGVALLSVWPVWILALLGGSAAALTLLAVFMTVRNRQRAIWFQALSAAGLASSALAACLAVENGIPRWAWWFWALHAAHFLAAILVVHARLEARIAARRATAFRMPRAAVLAQYAFLACGLALLATGRIFYGAAALLSGGSHLFDLASLRRTGALSIPMKRVGVRALIVSIVFTLLIVAGSF